MIEDRRVPSVKRLGTLMALAAALVVSPLLALAQQSPHHTAKATLGVNLNASFF